MVERITNCLDLSVINLYAFERRPTLEHECVDRHRRDNRMSCNAESHSEFKTIIYFIFFEPTRTKPIEWKIEERCEDYAGNSQKLKEDLQEVRG